MLGLVRSPVGTTALQVFSRVMLAAAADAALASPDAGVRGLAGDAKPWLLVMCMAWSVTEVVRYSFYGLNLCGISLRPLTFLRYSLFLVLYPLGVLGEYMVLFTVSPGIMDQITASDFRSSANGLLGSCMDAAYRWAYAPLYALAGHNVVGVLAVFFIMYVAGFPMLFRLMLAQRRKVLGGSGSTAGAGKQKAT